MARDVYVYHVQVQRPPGSEQPGWQPAKWEQICFRHDWQPEDDEGCTTFHWPPRTNYLSLHAANRCAALVREYGATASVERSLPVVWQSRLAAV